MFYIVMFCLCLHCAGVKYMCDLCIVKCQVTLCPHWPSHLRATLCDTCLPCLSHVSATTCDRLGRDYNINIMHDRIWLEGCVKLLPSPRVKWSREYNKRYLIIVIVYEREEDEKAKTCRCQFVPAFCASACLHLWQVLIVLCQVAGKWLAREY